MDTNAPHATHTPALESLSSGDPGHASRALSRHAGGAGVAHVERDEDSVTSLIRFALSSNVDVAKLEQLMAMKERVEDRGARAAYDASFAAMQAELPEIDKRGKIIIRDKTDKEKIIQSTPYALWDDTNRLIKPILAKHGFGLSFRISQTDSKITTTAVLSHVGGHREETSFSATIDATGSKNNVQGWGSSFSYGKRYTGTAILNITTRGEDDDGKAAGKLEAQYITDAQADELRALIKETGTDINKFLEVGEVESLSDITAAGFERAKALLNAKKRKIAQ